MSIRPSNGIRPTGTTSSTIDFKEDFTNSTAALAASHDETVGHILARLEQLQSKIAGQPEAAATPHQPTVKTASTSDLHSRVSNLESIHEDALHRLGSKLDVVERRLGENKEAEILLHGISAKFNQIESKLKENKEIEELVGKLASKFGQLESRIHTSAALHERVSRLESGGVESGPEQEAIIRRINAKLDRMESSRDVGAGIDVERSKKVKDLQARIEKLHRLKARYEEEEGDEE